jgi:glyoxylase-like metal-dependent hydrolase (beta-lactamase superfamily II)
VAHSVEILVPAQRYVFALEGEEARPEPIASSAEGFKAYKRLQAEGKPAAMVAIPNSCLIRASEDYVVDPGIVMQGAPYTSALRARGIDAQTVKKVILTHTHFDHVQALIEFPQREVFVHQIELDAPYTAFQQSVLDMVRLEPLTGDEGEIEPGVRWIRTPGHSEGLISILVDTDDGLVVIASDCVGPLPEYFDRMNLPDDFGPESEELLRQWERIRNLHPHKVIPGHNPPVVLDRAT